MKYKNEKLFNIALTTLVSIATFTTFSGVANAQTDIKLPAKTAWVISGTTTDAQGDKTSAIARNGNVGIGINSPVSSLHVSSTAYGIPATSGTVDPAIHNRMQAYNATLDTGFYQNGTSWVQSRNNADLSVNFPYIINPNGGSVGIGNASPQARLHLSGNQIIEGDFSGATTSLEFKNFGLSSGYLGSDAAFNGGQPFELVLGNKLPQKIHLATNTIKRLTIDSTGNVGIGNIAPTESLHIRSTIANKPNILLDGIGGAGAKQGLQIRPFTGMPVGTYVGFAGIDDGASSARAAILVPNAANNNVIEAVNFVKSTGNATFAGEIKATVRNFATTAAAIADATLSAGTFYSVTAGTAKQVYIK